MDTASISRWFFDAARGAMLAYPSRVTTGVHLLRSKKTNTSKMQAARGRFAGRTLRKSPVFALTAALAIAPGVGASTAIFSVTNAVLLRPGSGPFSDCGQ